MSVEENLVLFARGVIARLAIWDTLRIAVQENWGGPSSTSKQQWLAGVIVDAFTDSPAQLPDEDYIEELLLQIMDDEFDVLLEDDSAKPVAQDVLRLWADTRQNITTLVIELEARAERIKGQKVPAPPIQSAEGADSDSESGDEDEEGDDEDDVMDVDEHAADNPTPAANHRRRRSSAEIDEEGFTVVKKKR